MEVIFDQGCLKIYQNTKKGEELPQFTEMQLDKIEAEINPLEVTTLQLMLINIEYCCEELFKFLNKCRKCTQFKLRGVTYGTRYNRKFSDCLGLLLNRLPKVTFVDIRDTDLGLGWQGVLQSIVSCSNVQMLILERNNLKGVGKTLEATLTELTQLLFLDLIDSGMTSKELLSVVSLLPEVCSRLRGLLLSRHDLSQGGETLVQVVKGLPVLKSLVLGGCRRPGADLADIITNTTKNIELVDIADNDPITYKGPDLFKQIEQCKSLIYMRVSSSQFSYDEKNKLENLLHQNNGHLLVNVNKTNPLWDRYTKHILQIV